MNGLVLYIGIAVTFLTVWGVIMVGSYLLGRGAPDEWTMSRPDWVIDPPAVGDRAPLG